MKDVGHDKKDILVIGSYNVGLTFHTTGMPTWGETILGHGFSEGYGGKGSNQAVAAARLGGNVSFIGKLGEDRYGDDGLQLMKANNINTKHVFRTSKKKTGAGAILLNEQNDNLIIVDPGANGELTQTEMETVENVITAHDIIILQLEIPLETAEMAMKIAKKHNKLVILNPAPADENARKVLKYATIINPNESELLLLNGQKSNDQIDEHKTIELAKNLLNDGPEIVIVTRGEADCFVITEEGVTKVPVYPVETVDTTGAGDSFTGALAVALSEDKDIKQAVEFANLTGAYCVTKKEVIPGLPTQEELFAFEKQLTEETSR